MEVRTWGVIDNLAEGGVAVHDVDIFPCSHHLLHVVVMERGTVVPKDVTRGVIACPCS